MAIKIRKTRDDKLFYLPFYLFCFILFINLLFSDLHHDLSINQNCGSSGERETPWNLYQASKSALNARIKNKRTKMKIA